MSTAHGSDGTHAGATARATFADLSAARGEAATAASWATTCAGRLVALSRALRGADATLDALAARCVHVAVDLEDIAAALTRLRDGA